MSTVTVLFKLLNSSLYAPPTHFSHNLYAPGALEDSLDSDNDPLEDTLISICSNASVREIPPPPAGPPAPDASELRRREREQRRRSSFEVNPKSNHPPPPPPALNDTSHIIMEGIRELARELRSDNNCSKPSSSSSSKRKSQADDDEGEQEMPVLTDKVSTTHLKILIMSLSYLFLGLQSQR